MRLNDNDRWMTPQWVIHLVLEQFGGTIDTDPCWDPECLVPATYGYDARQGLDGLVKQWVGRCFVNPPYSDVGPWVLRAVQHASTGGEVVMLINASTDTSYWQSYVFDHGVVCFLGKRVKFTRAGASKPTPNQSPSAVLYFGKNVTDFIKTWAPHGTIVTTIKAAA